MMIYLKQKACKTTMIRIKNRNDKYLIKVESIDYCMQMLFYKNDNVSASNKWHHYPSPWIIPFS